MILVRYKVSKEDLAASNFMVDDDFIVKSVIIPSNRHALARYDPVRILFILMKSLKTSLILLQWNKLHPASEYTFSARYEVQEKDRDNRSVVNLYPLTSTQIGMSTLSATSPEHRDATTATINHQGHGAPRHVLPQIMQISIHPEDVVYFQSMLRVHWIYSLLVIKEALAQGR